MKLGSSPYEQYKVSDNEWCEYLPSVWQEKRVKNIFNLITDLAPDNNDFELLSLYTSIGVKPRKEMEQRGNKSVTTDGYWIVKKGDIIVNKLLAWMGAIGLSEYDGVTSPAYDILRKFNNEVDEKFYTYLFRTEKAQAIFKKYSRGIMDVRLRLYFDKFGAITVPFPPPSEQKAIANYLDTKTAQIERQIDLLTEKAKLYNNLKQSLINETVTRGLDKTVPMKNSGIEWIGEVPEHWEVKRLKDLGFLYSGLTGKTGDDFTDEHQWSCDFIPFVNIAYNQYILPTLMKKVIVAPNEKQNKVKKNDLFFLMSSENHEDIGKSSLLNEDISNTYLNSFCKGFRFTAKAAVPNFINYLISSKKYRDSFAIEGKGFTRINLKIEKVNNLFILLPPLSEQKKIVDYLDTKTTQIDKIIATINTQIEKLKELRKTLINDVVTGKIKVV
jgi:type I restriction enzyme S subunit